MKPQGTEGAEEAPKRKRGRPPRNAVAMTAAERKAASRMNQKQKEQDAERKDLIAALMDIYRSQQAHIISKVAEHHRIARTHEVQHLRELNYLSIDKLRLALEGLSDFSDTRGRLTNERRSGETGAPELERIVAARERNARGRRVGPGGAGPDS